MQGVPDLGPLICKGTQVECDLYDDRPLEALECSILNAVDIYGCLTHLDDNS